MSGPLGSSQYMYSSGADNFYPYLIEQSVRLDRASGSYFSRTPGSGTSQRKFTLSTWIKKSENLDNSGEFGIVFNAQFSSTTNYVDGPRFQGDDVLNMQFSGTTAGQLITNAKFKDPSSWFHMVIGVDTTQGTASNRVKIYINGTQITSFSTETYPNQNYDSGYGNNREMAIGRFTGASYTTSIEALLAETIYVDGTQYAASQFGETKNGVWIPKDPTGTSFGTNGFHLKYENASALGNDSSGNDNDFTANNLGADHQVLDSPTFGS